ncbi:MAG: hypothetical protein Ct9H90mP13_08650 [Pseudomonadota bacterium]|nr:MAG: hypothetical protein Ct9H90mP13_08650 [Pseudomonadota bacterium]
MSPHFQMGKPNRFLIKNLQSIMDIAFPAMRIIRTADFRIATKNLGLEWRPAMIEGGGLGKYDPTDIGPSKMHEMNGAIDYLAKDEKEATDIAKKLLSYFQGKGVHLR